jgi:hypothetical protein
MEKRTQYVAELKHVKEVSLRGRADLEFWKERLRGERLSPAEDEAGFAQVLIVSADARFAGVRFRELSFSVFVSGPGDGVPGSAAYLVRAFNSCRFFAFCERAVFSTPYYRGDVSVAVAVPASIRLALNGGDAFRAEMGRSGSAGSREPARRAGIDSVIPVILPNGRRGTDGQRRVFDARVSGLTETYPFLPTDAVTIGQPAKAELFQSLIDSGFAATEWTIRRDATHGKSKTYSVATPLIPSPLGTGQTAEASRPIGG